MSDKTYAVTCHRTIVSLCYQGNGVGWYSANIK